MTELVLPGIDPLPVWMAVAAVATLLAQAAVAKLLDLPLFGAHLASLGVPAVAQVLLTRLLPALELLAAVALLTPARAYGAALAAALLLAYGGVMAWHRAQGRRPDCGCGGEPLPVSWALVLRNTLLAALALVAGAPMAPRALGGGDFAVIAASLLLGTLLYAALHQVLRHRAGLRRVDPAVRRT